jgi:hypothetical protein
MKTKIYIQQNFSRVSLKTSKKFLEEEINQCLEKGWSTAVVRSGMSISFFC